MQLIDELRSEHELIDPVVGALRTYVSRLVRGEAPLSDGKEFLVFFRVFAGRFHHEREEEILLPALVREVSLPADRGPIAVVIHDHHEMAALLDAMEPLFSLPALAPGDMKLLEELAVRYSRSLWLHIDAENSVLFPESEDRLRRNAVYELACRMPDAGELAAKAVGEALLRTYPPSDDSELVRGEGCMVCPSYHERCSGIEREWWNEHEWEEFDEHIGAS